MLAVIGQKTILMLGRIGRITLFLAQAVKSSFSPPVYFREFIRQFLSIGFYSLPIVSLTAIFSGMVLALQTYIGFNRFSATEALATVVVLSITRELGPVLTGLMVAGRVGASMAAEVATMNVTDQIDAMRTLETDPFRYIVAPRFLATLISMPLLVLVADIIGIFGGYLLSVHYLDFNSAQYIQQTHKYLEAADVIFGLIKAAAFGTAVSIISCYCGMSSQRGAIGVGIATTRAVVWSSILIFILNYLLTAILF